MVAMDRPCATDGTTDRVGKYKFETAFAEGGDGDVDQLRSHRRRALTRWLVSEWRREHGRGRHTRPTTFRQIAERN